MIHLFPHLGPACHRRPRLPPSIIIFCDSLFTSIFPFLCLFPFELCLFLNFNVHTTLGRGLDSVELIVLTLVLLENSNTKETITLTHYSMSDETPVKFSPLRCDPADRRAYSEHRDHGVP